jgi:hypothetical protein
MRGLQGRHVAVVLALAASACGFTFERSSEVIDRRIIGLQFEPPEIVADGTPFPATVQARALVVEPTPEGGAAIAARAYSWRSCAPDLGDAFGKVDDAGRCARDDAATLVASGEAAGEVLDARIPIPPAAAFALQKIAEQTPPQGVSIYLHGQLEVPSSHADAAPVVAFARMVLSPNVPVGRRPNRNPRLVGLLFDGRPWEPGVPMKVEGPYEAEDGKSGATCGDGRTRQVLRNGDPPKIVDGCSHRVTPVFDESEAEDYVVQTFNGETRAIKERLRFAWYADRGTFNIQNTQQNDPDDVVAQFDPVSAEWAEPAEQPAVGTIGVLWVVVRDGRGGASWERRLVQFD